MTNFLGRFIGKLLIASFFTAIIVVFVLINILNVGDQEGSKSLFLFIVGLPLLTFLSALCIPGMVRSLGAGTACLGFCLLFLPSTVTSLYDDAGPLIDKGSVQILEEQAGGLSGTEAVLGNFAEGAERQFISNPY